jgi:cyclopropane fatty-acyl-phospholipid synthase-like methyltransferase
MELLLGCGSRREKLLSVPGKEQWEELVTLDINPDHNPDYVHNMEDLPLPFVHNFFDEIHAYEILEHTGEQGDWQFWFDQFSDFWRILKPGGLFFATVPMYTSEWAWGDPSHTRVIPACALTFLSQKAYADNVGKTPMSDFRFYYKADFEIGYAQNAGEHLHFVLKAINK